MFLSHINCREKSTNDQPCRANGDRCRNVCKSVYQVLSFHCVDFCIAVFEENADRKDFLKVRAGEFCEA